MQDRKMHLQTLVLVCLNLLVLSNAYKYFQDRMPNGDRVPHPCKPNILWEGVGHKNVAGTGVRNLFGVDFAANGMKWDRCICERDSDSDGRTNGEELGDPNCLWTEGGIPEISDGLSHPGVCEPIDDPKCMYINDWSFCEYTDEFECDAIENNPDVKEIEIRFPRTPVPDKETTYFCMTFDLPQDQEYHLIADKPLIDNKFVMHHIVLYGCDEPEDGNTDFKIPQPAQCGMAIATCSKIITLWTVGVNGRCLPEEYGYRIGIKGFKTVNMQVHWNNPELKDDYTDMSGMKLYLTPKLRQYDAGTLQFGAMYINIPPRMESVTQVGYCRSQCTENLPRKVHIREFIFHMHYLGRSGAIEHKRNGTVLRLIEAKSYNYDNPEEVIFDEPLEFLPGDELKITCNFKSTSRSRTTYYGEGTSDEMCFGFVTYYPALDDFAICTSYKSLDICPPDFSVHPLGACNYTSLYMQVEPIMTTILTNCYTACTPACKTAIETTREQQPCLQGDLGLHTETEIIAKYFGEYGKPFVEALHRCDENWDRSIIYREEIDDHEPNWTIDKTGSSGGSSSSGSSDEYCVFNPPTAGASSNNHVVSLGMTLMAFTCGSLLIIAH